MRKLILAALLLSACAHHDSHRLPGSSLTGTSWTLDRLAGAAPGDTMRPQTLVFGIGRANGGAGCNAWAADFQQHGHALRFGAPLMTKMACQNGMESEHAYVQALSHTRAQSVEGNGLTLSDGHGHELAHFQQMATSPTAPGDVPSATTSSSITTSTTTVYTPHQ